MARTVGIGVIGMGWMGQAHSRSYNLIPDRYPDSGIRPRLVVCADIAEDRAREAQQRFGFERCTTDWRDVIADPAVEVVNIATPNYLHREMAEAAANAGKHFFCEKPVGRYPEDVVAVNDTARRAGVLTWVGFNYRWAPLVQHARRMIADGRLGTITHYRSRFFAGYASDPQAVRSWRFDRDLSGYGTLGDLMPHVVDMAHILAGPISRVLGSAETFVTQRPQIAPGTGTHFTVNTGGPLEDVTNEDYVGVLVEFAGGARGTFEACRIINGPQVEFSFEVNGTEGALRWNFERLNELEFYSSKAGGTTRILSGPDHPDHVHFNPGAGIGLGYDDLKAIEAYHFMQAVADGAQGEPGMHSALDVARVQAAIARSWASETWEEVADIQLAERV